MTSLENSDHNHCSKCVTPLTCTAQHSLNSCPIVSCANNACVFKYHQCKQTDHLENTCPHQYVDCINKCNGCRLRIKRKELGEHLEHCPASIIQCSSYRVRRLWNKEEKSGKLKWPCPVATEATELATLDLCSDVTKLDLSAILLKQDYESLRRFALEKPLRFSRLYGYIIGLDFGGEYSYGNFGFLARLLKKVKSKVFKDIECENCVIFNNEEGCLACRHRIKNLEESRFVEMKTKYFKEFNSCLFMVSSYEQFIEREVHLQEDFLKVYDAHFSKPKKSAPKTNEDDGLNDRDLTDKLRANNNEILKYIELNQTLGLNESKEVPCNEFYDHSDAYKLKETTITIHCDNLIRRDEYADHYSLFHNLILPNAELIEFRCPMAPYGCKYFQRRGEFRYGKNESHRYLNLEHPVADLIDSDLTGSLAFNLDSMNLNSPRQIRNQNSDKEIDLLDLPFDVLFDIIDRLDSLSLYCLSMTSKDLRSVCEKFVLTRGIVYPKWAKKKNDIPEEMRDEDDSFEFREYRYEIASYAFSYSKHIESPSSFKLNQSNAEYTKHLQVCPYKRIREHKEKFRIC